MLTKVTYFHNQNCAYSPQENFLWNSLTPTIIHPFGKKEKQSFALYLNAGSQSVAANRPVKSRIISEAEFCGKQASGTTFHAIIRFKSGNVNTNRSRVRRRSFPPTRPVKVRIMYFIFYHQHQAAVQPHRCSVFSLALCFSILHFFPLWGFIMYLVCFSRRLGPSLSLGPLIQPYTGLSPINLGSPPMNVTAMPIK